MAYKNCSSQGTDVKKNLVIFFSSVSVSVCLQDFLFSQGMLKIGNATLRIR